VSPISKNALTVLEKRYLNKDENGKLIETVDDMFLRVAKAITEAETVTEDIRKVIEKEFYSIMSNLEFLPNSPTLMNAGLDVGTLSACYVLPLNDSMEEIFDSIKNSSLIQKGGGGVGISFSKIRPKGSVVASTNGVSSGPISFLKVFNSATEAVKQGGRRRGACMGMLSVTHPDIMEFISCKEDNSDITNFNLSVSITEDFMHNVENDNLYHLINPKTQEVIIPPLRARDVFDKIVDMAWKNGEPGIIFIDRMNKYNPTPEIGEYETTNPCGEQILLPWESCNLGSINLTLMTKNVEKSTVLDAILGEDRWETCIEIDWEKLERVTRLAVRFLDNVITVNKYILPEIKEMTEGTRKIGLGVMGWADLLYTLNIPYDSEEAINLAETIMRFIQKTAWDMSRELAKDRGVFPFWDKSIFKEVDDKVRNATTTTIAPTGTLSIIANVSSGIEPVFAIAYIRNVMDNTELLEVNPVFEKVARERGFYSESLMRRVAEEGTLKHIDEIPEDIKKVFVTSHDISPEWHVRTQAIFQSYVDNAVSKTVNLSNSATKEDVREVFLLANKLGCKGVTLYRDGSRDFQVLNIKEVKGKEIQTQTQPLEETHCKVSPRERPDITTGFTEKVKIGCGNLYITVNSDSSGICEVFSNTGRAGGCASQSEATSRLVSISLRAGIKPEAIIEQLKGIRCPSTTRQKGLKVTSCPDAIGRLIEKVVNLGNNANINSLQQIEGTKTKKEKKLKKEEKEIPNTTCDTCPECNKRLEHEGGCVTCRNCGFSKCG
jgi:ribonucleoside-diphosphate reductase alpha chain